MPDQTSFKRRLLFLRTLPVLVAFLVVAAGCDVDGLAPLPTDDGSTVTPTPRTGQTPGPGATSTPMTEGTTFPATSTSERMDSTPNPSASATSTPVMSSTPMGTQPLTNRAEHPDGVTISYPDGWGTTAFALVSTEFAAGAECIALRLVDREAPSDSGQAPFLYQSVVQICSRPAEDFTLEPYMELIYGPNKGGFAATEIAGTDAYERTEDRTTTVFFQNGPHLFQVLTSVATESEELGAFRREQAAAILASLRIE